MSSEAAQKAYPDIERGDDERYDDFEVRETIMAYSRAAFDAGAVEALRQAAEKIALYRVRDNPEESNSVFVLMEAATELAREWLKAESEEWAVGQ